MQQTKITPKGQTTIPLEIRTYLGTGPGRKVEWHVVRGMVMVDAPHTIKNPVQFLTSQTKLNLDMVRLVKEVREER